MSAAALTHSAKIRLIADDDRHRLARTDEAAWVRAAQAGSAEGIDALFRHHWRPAYRSAYLIVHDSAAAEDIAQEAFLSALRALDRFDRRRPFGPWLHRIVVNRAIDWSRARAFRQEVDAPADDAAPTGVHEHGDTEDVVGALGALPPDQRAVIVMRYVLGYTPGEIAKLLELRRGTVNSRLRRGLDRLAEMLRGEEP